MLARIGTRYATPRMFWPLLFQALRPSRPRTSSEGLRVFVQLAQDVAHTVLMAWAHGRPYIITARIAVANVPGVSQTHRSPLLVQQRPAKRLHASTF